MITFTISFQRQSAALKIDQAAAEIRCRFITGSVGQEIVYAAKLQQAKEYLAAYSENASATVPPYVAADVAAAGGTAVAAAEGIVAAASSFHEGPGPQIEQQRRLAKIAINNASDSEGVAAALAAGLSALASV